MFAGNFGLRATGNIHHQSTKERNMASLTGAHLFIRCLKQEGIEKVFTIVGDTILPLVDAAADEGI